MTRPPRGPLWDADVASRAFDVEPDDVGPGRDGGDSFLTRAQVDREIAAADNELSELLERDRQRAIESARIDAAYRGYRGRLDPAARPSRQQLNANEAAGLIFITVLAILAVVLLGTIGYLTWYLLS